MTGTNKNNNDCLYYKKLLSEYIDNEVSHTEAENITEHISYCHSCKTELANMYKMRDMIKSTYTQKVEVNFSSNVMAKIKNSKKKKSQNKNIFKILSYSSVAAVMLLILTGTVFYSQVKSNALMAEQRKFQTYVVEHTKEFSLDKYKKDENSTVISVNFAR